MKNTLWLAVAFTFISCSGSNPPQLTGDQKVRVENFLNSLSRVDLAVATAQHIRKSRNVKAKDEVTQKMGEILSSSTCDLKYPEFLDVIDAVFGNFKVTAVGADCPVKLEVQSGLTEEKTGGTLNWIYEVTSEEYKEMNPIHGGQVDAKLLLNPRLQEKGPSRIDGSFQARGHFLSKDEGRVGLSMSGSGFVEGVMSDETVFVEDTGFSESDKSKQRITNSSMQLTIDLTFSDFVARLQVTGDLKDDLFGKLKDYRLNGEKISFEDYQKLYQQGLLFWF